VHPPTTVLEHTMIKRTVFAAAAAGLLMAAGQASATLIDFENLAEGTVLSNQYVGVTFTANAFTGAGSSTSLAPWATTTDLTITNSVTGDVGGLGLPAGTVSGNVLHTFSGWLNEDGDPSFSVTFDSPINFFSAAFAGVTTAADVRIFAYNGAAQIGLPVAGTTTGQFELSVTAPSITSVIITPGSFNDWVGVDNINYTTAPVPEVSTYAMMALGMGLLAFKRRKAA
jgi:hypothetical protein